MWKRFKDEKGEFAIDAILGIFFFMVTLIAIMFFSLIIRVQSNIQYALGQTAKEISGYYYLVDKLGIAQIISGNSSQTDVDKTIDSIIDFSTDINDTASGLQDTASSIVSGDINPLDPSSLDQISEDCSDVQKVYEDFQGIKDQLNGLNGDSVKQVLSVFTKTAVNRAVSTFIAPFVCEKLIKKYLTAGDIDAYYESMGIKDVDFTGSQFLADKRSIKVEMRYKLNVKKYTLGFVDMDLSFRQVASTAAWVRPDSRGNLVSIKEVSGLYDSGASENSGSSDDKPADGGEGE